MLQIPERYTMVTGKGEGASNIDSLDSAFCNAGVGHINIFRVRGVLPPRCNYICSSDISQKGCVIPGVYSVVTNNFPGKTISSAIGVGIPEIPGEAGIIISRSGVTSVSDLTFEIETEITDIFHRRKLRIRDLKIKCIEHQITRCGTVISACLLFSESRG